MPDERDHQSRSDTERRGYDVLREQGIKPEHARRIAREASETVHRNVDKKHRG